MRFLNTLSPIILAIIAQIQLFAQSPPKVYRGKISQQIAVNSTTPIYKGFSNDVIAYSEYQILVNKKNTSYQLEPLFDAYGKASSFRLFKTSSSEEQRTIHFNPQLMPEVGEELPLFIMKGLDGVTYNSTKLKGRYVLLSFWVRFEKPYYTLASTRIISDFIKKQKVNGIEVVSLATTHNSTSECLAVFPKRTDCFIPIPESYGFNHRYHIGQTPYFILIDKSGSILEMASHLEFNRIGDLKLN